MKELLNIIYLCTPTYSHFGSSRILDVLKGLQEEGHNIIVSSGSSLEDYVIKKGFRFFDNGLNPVKKQEEYESINTINAIQMSTNYLNPQNTIKAYEQTKEFIQKENFDIILSGNLCRISPWLSEKLDIPYVVMSFQRFILPQEIAKFFEKPVDTYIQGVSDFIKKENLHPELPHSKSPVGIPPSKYLNLIFSSPSFEGEIVENGICVGGTKIERDPKYREKLEDKIYYKKGKNIYYSSGTLFWDSTQVKEVIALAKKYKINMFVSEGRLFKIKEKLPKNIKVYGWIPPQKLDKLIPEMDLVIAQGGLGLITRTIRSGVPLFITPIMPGNFPQTVKVNKYGNGIGLLENKLGLEEAFEELLYKNPEKYKSKALQLQKEFNQLGGSSEAVKLIKKVAYSHS